MSDSPLTPILAEVTIEASLARVWEVLTSEATVPHWLGARGYSRAEGATFTIPVEAPVRAGGAAAAEIRCEVKVLQPPHKFAFTWCEPGAAETLVQVSLFEEGEGRTFLRLVHEDWERSPTDRIRSVHDQLDRGWPEISLRVLERLAESA